MMKNPRFSLIGSLLCCLLLGSMRAQADNDILKLIEQSAPYIEVSATAEAYIPADEIYLNICIDEKDYGKDTSLASKEKQMLSALQSLGIDIEKNLVVNDLASNFKQYLLRKGQVQLKKNYSLKTGSAKQATQVLMAMEEIGVSRTSIDKAVCSQLEKYQDSLRVEAAKKAKAKADQIAEALDHRCGEVLSVAEQSMRSNNYMEPRFTATLYSAKAASDAGAEASSVADIEFEKIYIESTIRLKIKTYEKSGIFK